MKRNRVCIPPEVIAVAHARLGKTPIHRLAKELGVASETLRNRFIHAGLPLPPRRTARPKAEPRRTASLPVVTSDFIKPPTKAQLMAGR